MIARRWWFLLCAFSLALIFLAIPVHAGGWATITVNDWPVDIVAGQPVLIRFTVRQHGQDRSRLNDLSAVVTAVSAGTNQSVSVNARPEGRDGLYTAKITFPSPGDWSWSIQAFGMDQPLPILSVKEGEPQATARMSITSSFGIYFGLLGSFGIVLALIMALRRRARWALVLAVLGLLVGGFGFASASEKPEPSVTTISSLPSQMAPEKYGEVLFVAKGCVTCHINRRIDKMYVPFSTGIGPDLTEYHASPEFLRLWLADPLSVRPPKSDFSMPNLELSSEEIEALIAFINSGPVN